MQLLLLCSGYDGAGTDGTCLNVDECAEGTAVCPDNSNCLDTDGSYSCPCVYGYKAAGSVCENIDECALGNNCDQVSQNLHTTLLDTALCCTQFCCNILR